MRLVELAVLYLLVGLGSAAGLLMLRRPLTATTVVDAALLGSFWPLYGPFLLLQERGSAAPRRGAGESSERAESADMPLASLLPDWETAETLERRLALARDRVDEIDQLLARPELSEARARARLAELIAGGDERAAATVRQRLQSIRRLQALRARFSAELTEIREIIAQFRIQAEVVRLAGEEEGGDTRELLNELHLRLETIDEMLGEETRELERAREVLP